MSDLVELYCSIDDFWKFFKSEWDKHLMDRTWPHGPNPALSTPNLDKAIEPSLVRIKEIE